MSLYSHPARSQNTLTHQYLLLLALPAHRRCPCACVVCLTTSCWSGWKETQTHSDNVPSGGAEGLTLAPPLSSLLTCAGPGPPPGGGQRPGAGWAGPSRCSRTAPTARCAPTAAGSGDLWRSWFPRHDGGTRRPAASAPPPGQMIFGRGAGCCC